MPLTITTVYIEEAHKHFAEERMLNFSELVRYLLNNYEPYKQWEAEWQKKKL